MVALDFSNLSHAKRFDLIGPGLKRIDDMTGNFPDLFTNRT
jgi:hypothetical protein